MSLPPLDKWSRDYSSLLLKQAQDLQHWKAVLRPEVYGDLEAFCRRVNRPASREEMDLRASLTAYKAGGIHICPVGLELHSILFNRSAYEQGMEYVTRSVASVFQQAATHKQQNIMKEVSKKFAQIAALFAEVGELLANAEVGGGGDAGSPLEALALLCGKKDPKLVAKVLGKFGAEFADGAITDLDEGDIEKATEKIEALDDAEGGDEPAKEEKAKGGKVTLEDLKELAQELITAGKADDLKAVLKKHGAAKVSVLAEKEFKAVHAKLVALKD